MRHTPFVGATFAALLLSVTAAAAADGVVKKIDESAGKITLDHGPIQNLGMDEPMAMVFRAADPALLKAVKVGDKVTFEAERVNGQITVTAIRRR
ncbi:copper-binding protein [Methylopila musalis]|uniref:Copper-binding protein n=1 Tax=Methylopila musalis TaxID=1134781 RepID=A0ABW3Z782_9HYPH